MTVRRIIALAVAIAGLTLTMAACGGGDSSTVTPTAAPTQATVTAAPTPLPSGATPDIDECSLVTPAELNQIVPGQGFAGGDAQGDFCHFTGTTGLLVEIGTADLITPEEAAQTLQDSATRTTSTKVDGLGDAAYWQPSNSQLAIVVGKLGIVVDVFTSAGDTAQSDEATAIAHIALGRLPQQ